MKITITDRAREEIEKKVAGKHGALKLYYDHHNCGCTGGVPSLWFVESKAAEKDIEVQTNAGTILMDKANLVYFDEPEYKIDFSDSIHTFQLKSSGSILNPTMQLIMK